MTNEYVFYVSGCDRYAIASKEFWNQNHRLSDESDPHLIQEMERLGFAEARENQFEYQGECDAISVLTDAGFEEVTRQ